MSGALQQPGEAPQAGAEILRALSGAADFIEAFRTSLVQEFKTRRAQTTGDPERINSIISVLEVVPNLSNQDYRALVGVLNEARNSKETLLLPALIALQGDERGSKDLRWAVGELRRLYELFYPSHGIDVALESLAPMSGSRKELKVSDIAFATEALTLIRAAYPFGVNLINPTWEQGEAHGIPITQTISLRMDRAKTSECIRIRPKHFSNCSLVEFLPAAHGEPLYSEKLEDGDAIVIGRRLSTDGYFGADVSKHELEVLGRIPGEYGHWSRGGAMVARFDGRHYLFDRGSRHPISFEIGGDNDLTMTGTYSPESIAPRGGNGWDFGKSQIIRRPSR